MSSEIAPFVAMGFLRKANALKANGAPVVSLAVGQPGARLPEPLRNLIAEKGQLGQFGYTDALGTAHLQKALAKYHNSKYTDNISADQIAITNGASGAFSLAFLACFKKGDRIGIAIPGYPAYRNIIKALGFVPVEIRVDSTSRWCLSADLIHEAHVKTPLAGVLVASPANPTGTMLSAGDLRSAVEVCQELGIRFISDEIYHGLVFDGDEVSARPMGENVIVINSFSKYFCMTGWRIGWMILPKSDVDLVERLAQNMFICPPDLSQSLALAALDNLSAFDEIKANYATNRSLLLDRLPELGFDGMLPIDGAFYAYVPVTKFANDSVAFAERILNEIHVAVTPGIDFDPEEGRSMMRLSFAGETAEIVEALDRLESWLPQV